MAKKVRCPRKLKKQLKKWLSLSSDGPDMEGYEMQKSQIKRGVKSEYYKLY